MASTSLVQEVGSLRG